MAETDFLAMMPFAASLGITIDSASKKKVVGALAWSQEHTTAGGTLHGGALMTLADSVAAACAFLNLPAGGGTSTTSSATVFMGALRSGSVTATAKPLHVGRSTIVVLTELRDDDNKLVAQVTQTQAVLAAEASEQPEASKASKASKQPEAAKASKHG